MRDKDTGVISKHYHHSEWINLWGKIVNVCYKEEDLVPSLEEHHA